MKNIFVKIAAITSLSLIATFSQASLIGSITHDYGSQYTASSLNSANSCDTMNSDSVTIRNSSNCQRFYDLFDLSSINYDTIDYFELTLSFSRTLGIAEWWTVRPAASTSSTDATQLLDLQTLIPAYGSLTQSFTFNVVNNNVFDKIVDNQNFYLWFAHLGLGNQNFRLADAKLDVFGTLAEVPEPAPLALLSLSLIALALGKRRKN
ncbi:PEP-CTERM sorting domain-containing protein [Paraglaciecola hydrolytica]|uniref:PEP-CTERM protein-sorting domain-containing protein n=1 Tax=Paraglaciecola hydrolytica TaxID=1799789 RepID=A0A136A4R6_9ALTE|nr:PEP-CTERM sorting domain-containing protein [Paraglaciecola hydrolytica]KXI30196.1 hypothetical protein AX660_09415 [Paraglaciecola hydrolytica]